MLNSTNKQLERMINVMTDEIGIIQHCDLDVLIKRNKDPYPYSIDDVARALIVLARFNKFNNKKISQAKNTYLNYFKRAQTTDGFYYNHQNLSGNPIIDENSEEDSFARTMWAFSELLNSRILENERINIREEYIGKIPLFGKMTSPNSQAISLISLSNFHNNENDESVKKVAKYIIEDLSDNLSKRIKYNSEKYWVWYSDKITYDSARIPQALLLSSEITNNENVFDQGKKTLDFLIDFTFRSKFIFSPVGTNWINGINNWFTKKEYDEGNYPSDYDQQSIEASSMVEACKIAKRITLVEDYSIYSRNALAWYEGYNINHSSLLSKNGGVYDALVRKKEENPEGLNKNQGAESLIGYLMATTFKD